MTAPRTEPVRLADYRPTPYAISAVDLAFALDPERTEVTATLRLARRPGTPAGTALELDGDELDLAAVAVDGEPLPPDAYTAAPDKLTIARPPEGPFALTLVTRLAPAANTKLMGLYRSSGNYCTQCEAEGFRRITYFYDRPDVLAVYTTRIEAPKADAPHLLANGNRVDGGDIAGTDRHFAVWHDPFPKPAYLFALVAGDFDVLSDSFTTLSGRSVALEIFVEKGKADRAGWAMDSLKRAMAWDEKVFGREYDLDIFMIVAVSDFNMGAMENKGLNVFNDKYVLARPETATDADYAHIEGVIAHEYFHNWTGNRITCRDWFQLCLKEGLTVFRDQEFSADERSRPVKRIADVRLLRSHQFPEDAGPLAHPVRPDTYREINNFYTATVYEKGAEVVRMLKTILGEAGFRAGMDRYFDRHDGEAATIEQFLKAFEDACDADLSQFALWYHQSGTPALTVSASHDPARRTYTLSIEQSCPPTPGQPTKRPMVIPVRFGLVGGNGADMDYTSVSGAAVRDDVLILTEPRHEIVFEGVATRPIPSLLRGFSAPVKLDLALEPADLLFLAAHDSDPFNRWQALQTVATRHLIAAAGTGCRHRVAAPDPAFLSAVGRLAVDATLDPAFRALALSLPGETDIAREIGADVDPDAILKARLDLRAAIGRAHAEAFAGLADAGRPTGAFRPDAAAAGERALGNAALDYLVATGAPEAASRALTQACGADNMTDRLAALTALVHAGAAEAAEALAVFETSFGDDPLAMDKWFSVQATAPVAGALDTVKALMRHPGFSMSNPNRVRALITAFATGNQTQFARADGAGFAFVADQVLDLDRRNPQVAARLLSAFRSWRALEAGRRDLAERALRRVAAAPDLSRDVADIAQRSLSG
jgi:aminopeptidase N